jgi:hypothetical protein
LLAHAVTDVESARQALDNADWTRTIPDLPS